MDHSAKLFKMADCSKKMKGELVGKMKNIAAGVRAAANIMTVRAREGQRNAEMDDFRKKREAATRKSGAEAGGGAVKNPSDCFPLYTVVPTFPR